MATTLPRAADRFTDSILESWDNASCWLETAAKGLSETDAEALHALCDESDEGYTAAEAEVLEFVRSRATEIQAKRRV